MLRLSKLTDYGTIIMTHLARSPGEVQSATDIASGTHVALPTVSKVLKLLTQDGLVVSYRGAQGGYCLARAPGAISVAEIIAALEGPIAFTECSVDTGLCDQEASCAIRANWQKINAVITSALQGVTLAEMLEPVMQTVDLRHLRPVARL
jgi:FeS assembly SUF system regulator